MTKFLSQNHRQHLVRKALRPYLQPSLIRIAQDKLVPELGTPPVRDKVTGHRSVGYSGLGTLYGEVTEPPPE